MDLILWRHAEAQVLQEGGDDLARTLTPKGERQAQRMAHWLNHRLAASTRVLVSPAERTRRTAAALERDHRIVPALAPDASPDDILQAARWPRSTEPVLVIGHQPALGQVAALLLSGAPLEWSIKKGAVWWLRSRLRDDQLQVVLQAVQAPDCL
ncbi:histidine phosphatase family protein [Paucibacter sp. APW11]|uniref:Histidine phosphatase family protein n=1 Tax=Roseateles aquae TaxID=3077235 RepID=A0ABU3PEF6_9BURK|nr:histidine phosphatase family protein [Paucibacter sp. APW11]MDT9000493.1 histidine phosphatase family protein [Paucibacter sp. APW11]